MNLSSDQLTQNLEVLILQIAHAAEKNNKKYYIGGGFAIDIYFGGLSRPHEDIDFYPMEKDTEWWKKWFSSQKYIISKDTDMKNLPNAFCVLDTNQNYIADVYPVVVGDNAEISMTIKEGTKEVWDGMLTIQNNRGIWKNKSWNEIKNVKYKGQIIALENYKTVLKQKEEYIRLHPSEKLSEKHLHDFKRAEVIPFV